MIQIFRKRSFCSYRPIETRDKRKRRKRFSINISNVIQPKITRSKNNRAAALIGDDELNEAGQLLENIIQQYPKFPLAQYHLGLLRERQGRFAEARTAYETEVTNHPKSVAARFNLGN